MKDRVWVENISLLFLKEAKVHPSEELDHNNKVLRSLWTNQVKLWIAVDLKLHNLVGWPWRPSKEPVHIAGCRES